MARRTGTRTERRPELRAPAAVLTTCGALVLLLGLGLLGSAGRLGDAGDQTRAGFTGLLGVLAAGAGVGQLLTARGVRRARRRSRTWALVLSGVGIVLAGLVTLAALGGGLGVLLPIVLLLAYVYVFVTLVRAGGSFDRR